MGATQKAFNENRPIEIAIFIYRLLTIMFFFKMVLFYAKNRTKSKTYPFYIQQSCETI